jgi:molybdopterin adenylyltransferase
VSNAGGRHFGLLSRGVCGTIGQALICNVAGSTNGAIEGLEAVLPAIPHILELLRGDRVH